MMKKLKSLFLLLKLFFGLVLIFILAVLISPTDFQGDLVFTKTENLLNILRQVSENGILAGGMTLVILTGGIDLSVGSILALSSTLCAMLMMERTSQLSSHTAVGSSSIMIIILGFFIFSRLAKKRIPGITGKAVSSIIPTGLAVLTAVLLAAQAKEGFSVTAACLSVLSLGILIGMVNGVIVARGKIQSFIVTLAMMSATLGFARLISKGAARDIAFGPDGAPSGFEILRERILGIPTPAIFFLLTIVILHLLLTRTCMGRYIYAIGDNEEASRLSGVPVDKIKISVFAVCSGLAALAGIIHCAQNMQGNPNDGIGLELDAIAAVVIGGVSLAGGRGKILGTLAGVLIIGILNNIMGLKNVDSNFQLLFKGLIIVAAVLMQQHGSKIKKLIAYFK
jgi:simple sugar transport system permease protein